MFGNSLDSMFALRRLPVHDGITPIVATLGFKACHFSWISYLSDIHYHIM